MFIKLRDFEESDLENYFSLNHPNRSFHKLNGPYFKKVDEEGLLKRIEDYRLTFKKGQQPLKTAQMIVDEKNCVLGQVSCYWKSQETNWLEIGIVIYDEKDWGKGIGLKAMTLWIDHVFNERPDLHRIGLTTWSGNHGMMKLSDKLGMVCEARYRQARIVEGIFYDSVSYGILREEWVRGVDHSRSSK